ncbi:tetratricopeptide repeat protein [Streptomyces sp. NPDC002889]|uniref:tetratricopeptide repeat protein n=1 Tax=Streptomyces sp. NPDC002889 TaxID=3364669 RepID=UPI00367D63D5
MDPTRPGTCAGPARGPGRGPVGFSGGARRPLRLLGADHIDTLWTRHNLAWIAGQRGDFNAAEAEYRAVLNGQTHLLGEDHPHTQSTSRAWRPAAPHRGPAPHPPLRRRTGLVGLQRRWQLGHPSTDFLSPAPHSTAVAALGC